MTPRRRTRRPKRRTSRLVRQRAELELRCYLCDGGVKRDDEIVRVHEATMHRRCYEADIRHGR